MIDCIKNAFNNREIALILWILPVIILMLFDKNIRKSIGGLFIAITNKWLLISISGMIIYIALWIYGFYVLKLWDYGLLKDTIVWTFGVAFIMIMNSSKSFKDKDHFKKILFDNFKLLVILIFIVNLYVFNLIAELFIVPLLVFFGLMQGITESKEEFKPVKNTLDYLFSILCLGYLIFAIIKIVQDSSSFMKIDNLKSFLLPIILTILFIPFAYLYALIMLYQTFFIRLKFTIKNDKYLIKYSKWRTLWMCNLSLRKLNMVSKSMIFFDIKTKEDLNVELCKALNTK